MLYLIKPNGCVVIFVSYNVSIVIKVIVFISKEEKHKNMLVS